MNEITLNAYAKINLFLEVNGKGEDGFHTLSTFFQSVDLCDTLTLKRGKKGFSLLCTDPALSCGEDNLVSRAAEAFFGETGREADVSVILRKKIPTQAGLGGGSADAAAALYGLNLLYGSPLGEDALYRLAETLGSDVPFCLRGGSAFGSGRGTVLSPSPALPPFPLVIAVGSGEKMPTKDAYRAIDGLQYAPVSPDGMRNALESGEIGRICDSLFNRFGDICVQEDVRELLRAYGARGTLLCGSGAAVFGIFEKEEDAAEAADGLNALGHTAFVSHPI